MSLIFPHLQFWYHIFLSWLRIVVPVVEYYKVSRVIRTKITSRNVLHRKPGGDGDGAGHSYDVITDVRQLCVHLGEVELRLFGRRRSGDFISSSLADPFGGDACKNICLACLRRLVFGIAVLHHGAGILFCWVFLFTLPPHQEESRHAG